MTDTPSDNTFRPTRRRFLRRGGTIVGAALLAGAVVRFGGPPWRAAPADPLPDTGTTGPPADNTGPVDDLPAGVVLTDKGFGSHPPRRDGDDPVLGVGVALRNTTDTDLWLTAVFTAYDASGTAVVSDGTAVTLNPAGRAPVPAGGVLELGMSQPVPRRAWEAVADVAVAVTVVRSAQDPPTPPTATVTHAMPSTDGRLDLIRFVVDNPGPLIVSPDYTALYRDGRGHVVGGWFTGRAGWADFADTLPDDETDRFPTGVGRHLLPVWLPPGQSVSGISLTVWPTE